MSTLNKPIQAARKNCRSSHFRARPSAGRYDASLATLVLAAYFAGWVISFAGPKQSTPEGRDYWYTAASITSR